jgi:hypothetical protein
MGRRFRREHAHLDRPGKVGSQGGRSVVLMARYEGSWWFLGARIVGRMRFEECSGDVLLIADIEDGAGGVEGVDVVLDMDGAPKA